MNIILTGFTGLSNSSHTIIIYPLDHTFQRQGNYSNLDQYVLAIRTDWRGQYHTKQNMWRRYITHLAQIKHKQT